MFVRQGAGDKATAAQINRISVEGTADEKYSTLSGLRWDDPRWQRCTDDWSAPFNIADDSAWNAMPSTIDLIPWSAPGIKPNRTWVYAPEEDTLTQRWNALIAADPEPKPDLFKESTSRHVNQLIRQVPGMKWHKGSILSEGGDCPRPCRIAYRSFDRQWTIPDARLHHRPSPPLWYTYSRDQVFISEQHTQPSRGGIGLVFTSLMPDMDHFMGHHGGRVLPLYRDNKANNPNVPPGLLALLSQSVGFEVSGLDLFCYIAAVTAHRGYTARFREKLQKPGVRIPLTANPALWEQAVQMGKEVIWLHTYGERCVDPLAERPNEIPRMTFGRPKLLKTIPDTEEGMPDTIAYNAQNSTLEVGVGRISPVPPNVWDYTVSGMNVLKHWFGYRKKHPSGSRKSRLDWIVARNWTPRMTTELLDLLNVLGRCVALELRQAALLDEIVAAIQINVRDLENAGILPVPVAVEKAPKPPGPPGLWERDAQI